MIKLRYLSFAAMLLVLPAVRAADEAPALHPALARANALEFQPMRKAPFLGVFTHVEPTFAFPDKIHSMKQVLEKNPFITGFTLRIQWKQYHPEFGKVDEAGLEELVATAAAAGKVVIISLIPGGASPDWIYEHGVTKVGPVRAGIRTVTAPLPWDYRYLELYWGDLRRIANRYADDPRVWAITVLGHNFNYIGEEMHAPPPEEFKAYGWDERKFLDGWKTWIDLYDEMFPKKKLILVVSQNYRGADERMSETIAEYFVNKVQGRGILMSHQLSGRQSTLGFGPTVARKLSALAPSAHEGVGSLKEFPEGQGSIAMTIYNLVQTGQPLFFHLWRRDSDDPIYAKQILDAWNRYGWMNAEGLKAQLEREGLFVEKSPPLQQRLEVHQPRKPPPGYPGHVPPAPEAPKE